VTVVDASLAVKWYADEEHSELAENWLAENAKDIIVPDIFVSEVIGALVRHANIDKSLLGDSHLSIHRFTALFDDGWIKAVRMLPPQIASAAQTATTIRHPLKDCLYLALAMELNCELVTCDAKFAAKAKGVWDRVRVLGA
jgi:predicted nucleic acid-binding protein